MKITSFQVTGLLGRDTHISANLHPDLNILTGRNGAGKTSVLKLLWYIVSGNLLLALQDVVFQRALVKTDLYDCLVTRLSVSTCKVDFTTADGERYVFEDQIDHDDTLVNAEDQANPELIKRGGSVFFPTFRRIEGGFSLDTAQMTQTPGSLTFRSTINQSISRCTFRRRI
jgi:hypothetical protein